MYAKHYETKTSWNDWNNIRCSDMYSADVRVIFNTGGMISVSACSYQNRPFECIVYSRCFEFVSRPWLRRLPSVAVYNMNIASFYIICTACTDLFSLNRSSPCPIDVTIRSLDQRQIPICLLVLWMLLFHTPGSLGGALSTTLAHPRQ